MTTPPDSPHPHPDLDVLADDFVRLLTARGLDSQIGVVVVIGNDGWAEVRSSAPHIEVVNWLRQLAEDEERDLLNGTSATYPEVQL